MVVYAVTSYTETANSLPECLTLLQAKINSLENSRAIQLMDIHKDGNRYTYALVMVD